MAEIPAGWYPNPEDPSTERWWDGAQWTDTTRPTTAAPPFAASQPYSAGPSAWAATPGSMQKPDNYLVWSILVTLFCCLPFGIAAIVNSAKVDGLWASGDYYGAQNAAAQAKKWVTWSVVIGLVVGAIYGIAVVAAGSSGTGY